jgi:Glycosyltransferase family 87
MKIRVWFVLSLMSCGISWMYRHKILTPWEHYVNLQRGELKAQMGDLYPRWVGTRELLLHGRNPYGEDVSHEIQMGFYGHTIQQSYDKPRVIDEQRFAYPVYVVLFLAPAIGTDFAYVQIGATLVLGSLTAVGVCLWMRVLNWRPPPLLAISIALFVLSSPQIAQGLRLQQFGLLVGFLLALATWCVTRGYYSAAGALVALSTIKPQMVMLCIVWFLLWSVGNWSKRWPLVAGFGASLTLLVGFGEFLVPGWIGYFVAGLNAYRKYVPALSPIRVALGDWVGGALSILGVIVLFAFAWRHRTTAADSHEFLRILSFFCIVSILIFPLLPPFNQILVLLPVMMIIREWKQAPRVSRILLSAVLAWPGVVELAFLVHPPQIDSLSSLPLLPSALAPSLPFLLVFLLPDDRCSTVT